MIRAKQLGVKDTFSNEGIWWLLLCIAQGVSNRRGTKESSFSVQKRSYRKVDEKRRHFSNLLKKPVCTFSQTGLMLEDIKGHNMLLNCISNPRHDTRKGW